jgi:hypothetical protein
VRRHGPHGVTTRPEEIPPIVMGRDNRSIG